MEKLFSKLLAIGKLVNSEDQNQKVILARAPGLDVGLLGDDPGPGVGGHHGGVLLLLLHHLRAG